MAQIIQKVSIASEFWYHHETFLEVSSLKQDAKESVMCFESKMIRRFFENC